MLEGFFKYSSWIAVVWFSVCSENITYNPIKDSDIKKGDVISDSSFGTLTVKKIKKDYIVISVTEGFVEDIGEGINMNADDLRKIKLNNKSMKF